MSRTPWRAFSYVVGMAHSSKRAELRMRLAIFIMTCAWGYSTVWLIMIQREYIAAIGWALVGTLIGELLLPSADALRAEHAQRMQDGARLTDKEDART